MTLFFGLMFRLTSLYHLATMFNATFSHILYLQIYLWPIELRHLRKLELLNHCFQCHLSIYRFYDPHFSEIELFHTRLALNSLLIKAIVSSPPHYSRTEKISMGFKVSEGSDCPFDLVEGEDPVGIIPFLKRRSFSSLYYALFVVVWCGPWLSLPDSS